MNRFYIITNKDATIKNIYIYEKGIKSTDKNFYTKENFLKEFDHFKNGMLDVKDDILYSNIISLVTYNEDFDLQIIYKKRNGEKETSLLEFENKIDRDMVKKYIISKKIFYQLDIETINKKNATKRLIISIIIFGAFVLICNLYLISIVGLIIMCFAFCGLYYWVNIAYIQKNIQNEFYSSDVPLSSDVLVKKKKLLNKSPRLPFKMKRIYWIVLLTIDLLFIYNISIASELMYSNFNTFLTFSVYVIVLFLSPYILYKTLKSFFSKSDWPLLIGLGSVIIFGVSVGLTNSYQEKNILIAKGIWTKGVVTDKYKFYKRNTGIKYEFKTLNGIIIKSTADDESDNPFWIGDSIEVIYHPDIPELNRIDIEME